MNKNIYFAGLSLLGLSGLAAITGAMAQLYHGCEDEIGLWVMLALICAPAFFLGWHLMIKGDTKVNKARLLLLILGLSLLNGSVCMHPATLRITEMSNAEACLIPEHYYDYAPIIPAGADPYEWLKDLEWDEGYEVNLWDCSNMALYIEWVMENAGVPARVCIREGHAWVQIWRTDLNSEGEWWAYECVGLCWVNPWVQGRYYNPSRTFADVHTLRDWYGRSSYFFAREWCWWADTSDLWPNYEEI